jgi:hypothetical protein
MKKVKSRYKLETHQILDLISNALNDVYNFLIINNKYKEIVSAEGVLLIKNG